MGDEGGFAPPIDTFEAALDLLTEAISAAGYTGTIKIGMDPASSEFFRGAGVYDLKFKAKENDGSGKKSRWVFERPRQGCVCAVVCLQVALKLTESQSAEEHCKSIGGPARQ